MDLRFRVILSKPLFLARGVEIARQLRSPELSVRYRRLEAKKSIQATKERHLLSTRVLNFAMKQRCCLLRVISCYMYMLLS